MSFFDWFRRLWDSDAYWGGTQNQDINPATGLPMVGAVDVAGNAYGSAPSHHRSELPPSSGFDHLQDHEWQRHHSLWDDNHHTLSDNNWISSSHDNDRSGD